MDYAIFLWHSYEEQKNAEGDKERAMSHAIKATISSVVGSSITTVAGFLLMLYEFYSVLILIVMSRCYFRRYFLYHHFTFHDTDFDKAIENQT